MEYRLVLAGIVFENIIALIEAENSIRILLHEIPLAARVGNNIANGILLDEQDEIDYFLQMAFDNGMQRHIPKILSNAALNTIIGNEHYAAK